MLTGIGVSSGTACARIYVMRKNGSAQAIADDAALDAAQWSARLAEAVTSARNELTTVVTEATNKLGKDEAAIFDAQLLVLDDKEWLGEIQNRVTDGLPAPMAIREVSSDIAEQLRALEDDYLRERSADVLDVAERVLRQLGAADRTHLPTAADGEVVLAAEELSPSETLGLDPSTVRALVTERGTRTSHAAILARQLGIPAVVGIDGLLDTARDGVLCGVDGDAGTCELAPEPATAAHYRTAQHEMQIRHDLVSTVDGVTVEVCANAATSEEVAQAVAYGADGVGLFRTELLLKDPRVLHDEDRQVTAYAAAAAAAAGRPVLFRTFDIGADKPVHGLPVAAEANPFLGVRGIRLCLDRTDIFKIQLSALARVAAQYPNVEIMVPMVSGMEELDAVCELLRQVSAERPPRTGTMVEVPSAAVLAPELADRCTFLSVGTNDLTSYLLAADRNNPGLGGLYNELHPSVLRVLASVLAAGREKDVKVSVCGELAGELRALPLLLGMGLRTFSAAPPIVPRLKQAISQQDTRRGHELAARALQCARVTDVEQLLADQGR